MVSKTIECTFFQTPAVSPDLHDYRKGIVAALRKVFGAIGASKYVWRLEIPDKSSEPSNILRLLITLDGPSDITSQNRFFAAVSTTRVVSNDRVIFRVLDDS